MVCLILRNRKGVEEHFAGEFDAVKKCQDNWIRMLRWASLHPDSVICKDIQDRADTVTMSWNIRGTEQPLSDAAWPIKRLLRPDEWLSPDGIIMTNAQGNPSESTYPI